jgi:hypothetical protein
MLAMQYLELLLTKYKNKGILIDTNLLLLYFVGIYDPQRIPNFKRTMMFVVEDFYTLWTLFKYFDKVVTTPNILTEVNSLANQLANDLKPAFFSKFAEQVVTLEEHYIETAKLSAKEHFPKLGLTDSGILDLAKGEYLVLSDDFRLVGYLGKQGIDAINFNYIRTLNWR